MKGMIGVPCMACDAAGHTRRINITSRKGGSTTHAPLCFECMKIVKMLKTKYYYRENTLKEIRKVRKND